MRVRGTVFVLGLGCLVYATDALGDRSWCISTLTEPGEHVSRLNEFLRVGGHLCAEPPPASQRVYRLRVTALPGGNLHATLDQGGGDVREFDPADFQDLLGWVVSMAPLAPSETPPARVVCPAMPLVPAALPAAERFVFSGELVGLYGFGYTPGEHGFGGELRLRLRRGPWSVALGVRALREIVVPTHGDTTIEAGPGPHGVVAACRHLGWFAGCWTVGAGTYLGRATPQPREDSSALVLTGPRVEWHLPLGRHFRLRGDVEVLTPVTRIALVRGRPDGSYEDLWAMRAWVLATGAGVAWVW